MPSGGPATIRQEADRGSRLGDRRRPNAELRSREHLMFDEVERLIAAAKQGPWGHRDATVILVAYRHGLRASELTDLQIEGTVYLIRGPRQGVASQPLHQDCAASFFKRGDP